MDILGSMNLGCSDYLRQRRAVNEELTEDMRYEIWRKLRMRAERSGMSLQYLALKSKSSVLMLTLLMDRPLIYIRHPSAPYYPGQGGGLGSEGAPTIYYFISLLFQAVCNNFYFGRSKS